VRGQVLKFPSARGKGQHLAKDTARQFSSLLQCLSGLFYQCELASPWKMSFISDGVCALTGYTAQALAEHGGWASIIAPDDFARVQDSVDEALAAHTSFELAYRIRHRDGSLRWVSECGHAVYEASGRALFLEGVISDVSGQRQVEEMQRSLASRWRKILDTIPQMVWSMRPDGTEEYYNEQWAEFTGAHVGHKTGISRLDLVHPADREDAKQAWERALESGSSYEHQYRLRHKSGEYRWVLSRAHPERDGHGQVARWYGTCTEIDEQVHLQESLASHQSFVAKLISASPDALLLLDSDGRVAFANEVATKSLSLRDNVQLLGSTWTEIVSPYASWRARKALAAAGRSGQTSQFTISLSSTAWWDVIVTPIDDSSTAQFLVTARDITHQKLAEHNANWAAAHDPLTGLVNRSVLHQKIEDASLISARTGIPFALLLLDLDEFKRTNDTLGHDAGDALLCALAERLLGAARPDDTVARLGGDEFAVLLTNVGSEAQIEDVCAKLFEAVKEPIIHEGKLLECRTSVGASIYPALADSRTELLKQADLALYAAKAAGRGTLKVYQSKMRADLHRRNGMLIACRRALDEDLIVPFYQPKVDLKTKRVVGFEALLRWNDPSAGLQMPQTISAAFEDMTLAAEISDRMIDRVLDDIRVWLDRGDPIGHVAINAAAAEFRRGDFAESLLRKLRARSLPSECLQLEVTETVFLGRGAEYVERALKTLSAEGIKVALDDFGTGFASLLHLKQFPIDVLKIDRSFVTELQVNPDDGAIVDAVIGLGSSLRMEVVAEGVETRAQHDFLEALGCNTGQGYFYSPAVPATSMRALLND
jgi:diguanylate cyclase (GGDEF)-like protein/PAS domain S-box-containing protein